MNNQMVMSEKIRFDIIGLVGLLIARLIYGYLWYTQLLWKLPPTFGCPANFAVTSDIHHRTSGLCDWVGIMTLYSKIPLQASLVKQFVVPNMSWFGWVVFLMEAFVAVSMIFGGFTRLGGLAALIQGLNLYFGVTRCTGRMVLDVWNALYPRLDLSCSSCRSLFWSRCFITPTSPSERRER